MKSPPLLTSIIIIRYHIFVEFSTKKVLEKDTFGERIE